MSDRESGDEQQQPQAQGKALIVLKSLKILPYLFSFDILSYNVNANGHALFCKHASFRSFSDRVRVSLEKLQEPASSWVERRIFGGINNFFLW